MKSLMAIAMLSVFLTAGCVQSGTNSRYGYNTYRYLDDSDFLILNSTWAFEDNCDQGNYSVGYAIVSCYREDLKCEVYVNNVKSDYGLNALQDCSEGEITIAEMKLAEKPDFVSIQSGNSYFFTRRDVPRIVEICCSYLNETSGSLERDNEICKVIRLEAQCPHTSGFMPSISGFGQINASFWDLHSDGTMDLRVTNAAGQEVTIRKIYINNAITYPSDLPMVVQNGAESQNITVAGGPSDSAGTGYTVRLSVEYFLTSSPDAYLNSTGIVSGSYS
jgi:hypothetical protein